MYVFFTDEEKRKKCDSCKRKIEPPASFFAYGIQTLAYDVVARRICWDCINRLSAAEILNALRVSRKDSIEAAQSISELKK
jgi:hypothetical protein